MQKKAPDINIDVFMQESTFSLVFVRACSIAKLAKSNGYSFITVKEHRRLSEINHVGSTELILTFGLHILSFFKYYYIYNFSIFNILFSPKENQFSVPPVQSIFSATCQCPGKNIVYVEKKTRHNMYVGELIKNCR